MFFHAEYYVFFGEEAETESLLFATKSAVNLKIRRTALLRYVIINTQTATPLHFHKRLAKNKRFPYNDRVR